MYAKIDFLSFFWMYAKIERLHLSFTSTIARIQPVHTWHDPCLKLSTSSRCRPLGTSVVSLEFARP
jgi:hypothetical protein